MFLKFQAAQSRKNDLNWVLKKKNNLYTHRISIVIDDINVWHLSWTLIFRYVIASKGDFAFLSFFILLLLFLDFLSLRSVVVRNKFELRIFRPISHEKIGMNKRRYVNEQTKEPAIQYIFRIEMIKSALHSKIFHFFFF